jgi:hypothetical protein
LTVRKDRSRSLIAVNRQVGDLLLCELHYTEKNLKIVLAKLKMFVRIVEFE